MDSQRSGEGGATRAHGAPGPQYTNFVSALVAVMAICFTLYIPLSAASSSIDIVHQVPEGHVGVYWRGGALLKTITDPGFHLKIPFLTQYEPIQVTIQTDKIPNMVYDQRLLGNFLARGVQQSKAEL